MELKYLSVQKVKMIFMLLLFSNEWDSDKELEGKDKKSSITKALKANFIIYLKPSLDPDTSLVRTGAL